MRCEGGKAEKKLKQGDTETVRRAWRRDKQERKQNEESSLRESRKRQIQTNHEQETEEREKDSRKRTRKQERRDARKNKTATFEKHVRILDGDFQARLRSDLRGCVLGDSKRLRLVLSL